MKSNNNHTKQQSTTYSHNSSSKLDKQDDHDIQLSLLDITYPYYKKSMLSKSIFSGVQCLMLVISIYFSIMYITINYVSKGYFLKWHILEIISDNLIIDIQLILCFISFGLIWVYTGHLIIKMNVQTKYQDMKKIIYIYCVVWTLVFVSFAIYFINSYDFYFTDRIFIVVVSWSLAFKNSSFCLDLLEIQYRDYSDKQIEIIKNQSKLGIFWLYIKFIVSPMIIFKEFFKNHNPELRIHISYLLIKLSVAFFCLVINYILMTEFIQPFLSSEVHSKMNFVELFFKLIPYNFYIYTCLYYLILQNIVPAMAEITQLKNRRFYQDWWNAETISEFLDKWIVQINSFGNAYLIKYSKSLRHSINLTLILIMIFSVFQEKINLKIIVFALIHIIIVYLLAQNRYIQNNYIVHFLTISFPPFWLAIQLKYSLFD